MTNRILPRNACCKGSLSFRMLRLPVLVVLVGMITTLTACGREETSEAPKKASISGVKVVPARVETVPETVEFSGTVRSVITSVLSSKVLGRIVAVNVREGDRVRRGDVLVEIDDREIAARVKQAEAGLLQARYALKETEEALKSAEADLQAAEAEYQLAGATYKRFKALFARQSVSEQEFDEVRARYRAASARVKKARRGIEALRAKREQVVAAMESAKAALSHAEALLDYTRIVSPVDGVVTAKQAEIGQLASPGTPLVTVEDTSRFRLEVPVPVAHAVRLRVGDEVEIVAPEGLESTKGKISEIVPAVDPATRTALVKIDLPRKDRRSQAGWWNRSGSFARARFLVGQRKALLIPFSAVIFRGQLTAVFVAGSDNVARYRLIRLGRRMGDRVEVLSGLEDGERIVSERVPGLVDGVRITGHGRSS